MSDQGSGASSDPGPPDASKQNDNPALVLARRTIDLIEKFGAPPTPRSYGVLFGYLTKEPEALVVDVDKAVQAEGVLNSFDIERLHDLHFDQKDKVWQNQEAAADGLNSQMGEILSLVNNQVKTNARYSERLDDASTEIVDEVTPEQLRRIVDMLVTENQIVKRETEELNNNLRASQAKIESMQTSLASAREEGLRDSLTGLRNRRYFDATLKLELRRANANGMTLALCMVDLDHFKQINDKFGHLTGDSVLRVVGKMLNRQFSDKEVVARYGGEEFAIIMPGWSLEDASRSAEVVRTELQERRLVLSDSRTKLGQITASFGISMLRNSDGPEDLIKRADAKLYEAKRTGRNKVVLDGRLAA